MTRRRRKDGALIDVELHVVPLEIDHQIEGIYLLYQDISDRRAIEKMKDEFVSVVSHELRTPLTAIRGSLGLLATGKVGEISDAGRRLVEIATSNADRLIRLTNDILEVERLTSGNVSVRRQRCDAAALFQTAEDLLTVVAEKAGVTLLFSPVVAALWADADRIVQLLTNLVGNAIKFSYPGGTVLVRATVDKGSLVVDVRDQGRGIPHDKLATIFEPFKQVDASDSRQKGGTGLGLTISRSIVQQHGGKIWAESKVGQGSTFTFTLPVLEDTDTGGDGLISHPAGILNEKSFVHR
jgi:signal transduction histidine kinase